MGNMRDYLNKMRENKSSLSVPSNPQEGSQVPVGARKLGEAPGRAKREGKPKPPVIGYEKITCKCGHKIDFEIWPDKQDKFHKDRRQKVINRDCPECRHKAHTELQTRLKEEAKERKKNKQPKVPKWKREAGLHLERLPHGSTFRMLTYNAEKVEWDGKLAVPFNDQVMIFEATANALFRLCSELDSQWRRWLEQSKPKEHGESE